MQHTFPHMKESYLFHTKIRDSWSPSQVWMSILPAIQQFSLRVGTEYNVSCGTPSFSSKTSPAEIVNILRNHDDGSYLITWRNKQIQTMHSFSYFKRDRSLSCRFSAELVSKPLDVFGAALANALPLTNMVVQANNYLDSVEDSLWNPGSNNLFLAPCYNNSRDGYIEGVSAEMWLGGPFWQYAKCTKQDLVSQDWLHCEERSSHLYVRAWPGPFSSAEGEQGEIQRRLLDLLFGINAKTPPPLPAPPQGTVIQKVLVDGVNLMDLGREEFQPDGTRISITPPHSPA